MNICLNLTKKNKKNLSKFAKLQLNNKIRTQPSFMCPTKCRFVNVPNLPTQLKRHKWPIQLKSYNLSI